MRVDMNEIGMSLFRYHNNANREDIPQEKLNILNGDIVSDIRNYYSKNFTESDYKAIDFLKMLLEYIYINDIDLNKYISLNVHEKN